MKSPTQRGQSSASSTLVECKPTYPTAAQVGARPERLIHSNPQDAWDCLTNEEQLLDLINDLRARVAVLEELIALPEERVKLGIERAVVALGKHVVRIRFSFGSDHDGDPALRFRVVLPDADCARDALRHSTERVQDVIRDQIDFRRIPEFPYFNYRSETEANARPEDLEWA